MKHAVIIAHPKARSFTVAMAKAYGDAAAARGGRVVVRDLYRVGFDPCLHAHELPDKHGFAPREDVVRERAALADADVFALFYPLWFNAPPAMMKGYIDRVFSMGFGYGTGLGGQTPLLDGRKLISFTSSGAPERWVRDTGAFSALTTLFDQHIANMCGLQILDHVHVGGVVSGFPRGAMDDARAGLKAAMDRHGLTGLEQAATAFI
jgi:NAD(P)H dehydrogenase (quinone)